MTTLQEYLQSLEDPPTGGTDVDLHPPAAHHLRHATVPTVTDEPPSVHIRVVPGSISWGAVRLALPESPPALGGFNFLRAPGPLGRVFAEVLGPDGGIVHPNIEGLNGSDTDAGFGPCSGRVSERYYDAHSDVLRQDAKLVVYLEEDGTCLHGGRLRTPARAGGAVTLSSPGHAARADKLAEPILYSTEDMSIWNPLVSEDDDLEPRPWTVEAQQFGFSSGEITNLSFRGPSVGDGSAIAWLPGQNPARLTGKIGIGSIASDNGALIEIQTRRVGFSYDTSIDGETPDWGPNIINWTITLGPNGGGVTVLPFDIDLTIDNAALDYPNMNPDNRGPSAGAGLVYPDLIQIIGSADPEILAVDRAPILNIDIVDLVVYGDAGPLRFGDHTMSPTQLVLDLAGRMGLRLMQVEASGGNILPYQIEAGMPYRDGFDWADVLTGWRTRILDTGHRAILQSGPWDTNVFQVASPWAKLDVAGMDRFNRVRIPFIYKDGATPGSTLVRADPDPLNHRSFYGLFAMDQPKMNSEAAENVGAVIARQLSGERFTAQFDVGELIGAQGPTSGHHLMAGDTLDGSPRGAPGGLRVVSKEWTPTSVSGQAGFDASSGSAMTGIPALDRMLARRANRLRAKGRAA